jgi:hypothetical protein
MLVFLGQDGAPERLDAALMYELQAWHQGQPSASVAFFFDLAGPAKPGPVTPTIGRAVQLSEKAQACVDLSRAVREQFEAETCSPEAWLTDKCGLSSTLLA